MRIQLLNHASIILELDDIKLLCDPWFSGTCFHEGWSLRYDNPLALEAARECTHLWISHFHQDHFHSHTLKALADVNPNIMALGNHSYNFQLDDALKHIGFRNVRPIYERQPIQLNGDVTVTRFPASAIDNMLLIRLKKTTILNYNDCNIPLRAEQALVKKMGNIDILLISFNHAGKILEYPLPAAAEVKKRSQANCFKICKAFRAKCIIPFASHHYYKTVESQAQNESLLEPDELIGLDRNILPLRVGESVAFDASMRPHIRKAGGHCTENQLEGFMAKRPSEHYSFETLRAAAQRYGTRLRRSFFYLLPLPKLRMKVEDMGMIVCLDSKHGLVRDKGPRNDDYHIAAHSSALYRWFDEPHGTEYFVLGAHFAIQQKRTTPLKGLLFVSLLVESRLDLKSLIQMLLSVEGQRFVFNRREEIAAVVREFRFHIGFRT